tara:strand:+ start:5289 stop:6605 length:1317 start_codon:yes stop_codon:yes gene_type:complete
MTSTKHIHIFSIALIAAAIGASPVSHAQDTTHVAPLHIKMSPSNQATPKKVKVTTAKPPSQSKQKIKASPTPALIINEKDKMGDQATNVTAQVKRPIKIKQAATTPPRHIDVDAILGTISCRNTISSPLDVSDDTNHTKKLADSLKAYLTDHKQSPAIIDTLYDVSQKTGVDFELLVITAMIESDLGRITISSSSSARGIYQYIEPTWLILMKRYGYRIGYPSYADAIEINTETRRADIHDNDMLLRQKILDLRYNQTVAAQVKALQIKDEKNVLRNFKNGQTISITDHYIVHMLGLSLARTFYELKHSDSDIILANLKSSMFQEAIRLNRTFFYDRNGTALNADAAYHQFEKKIAGKFSVIRKIDADYGQGNNVSGDTCPADRPNIRTVSSQDVLAHKIAPLPVSSPETSTETDKVHNILSKVGAYAKTIKVPLEKQ